jgi:hypothetical protein
MKLGTLTQLIIVTLVLSIGLGGAVAAAYRVNLTENWDEKRCDPYVVAMAGFLKPYADPRTPSQFARDNWNFCQKQYVQRALSVAAEVPKRVAAVAEGSVGTVGGIVSVVADVFYDLWKVCYQMYASFMERMKGVAKLFRNFIVNLHSIVDKMNAAILAMVYGLISLILTIVNSVQVTLIVTIIVIGIILILQILLFFLFMPISSLILTITAIVATTVVTVIATIAAIFVNEMFGSNCCFVTGTPVLMQTGISKPIEEVRVGDILRDGGVVTAFHEFWSDDPVYDVHGIGVTGDHLIVDCDRLIPVSEHRNAVRRPVSWWPGQRLWCLTTSTRRIPCNVAATFADWEEIPEDDEAALIAWHSAVWHKLNPDGGEAPSLPMEDESGLTADTLVACRDWLGRRIHRRVADIRVGDRVCSSETETTSVVGVVTAMGDLESDAIMLPGLRGRVRAGTWIFNNPVWEMAAATFPAVDKHPVRWYNLYTKSGTFLLEGGWRVRDASDVGLEGLKELVNSVVLDKTPSPV